MITFSLYGELFTFNGQTFTGDNKSLIDLMSLYLSSLPSYLPIGHLLKNILDDIYPEEIFDFTNEDRSKNFYIVSAPDARLMPTNIDI